MANRKYTRTPEYTAWANMRQRCTNPRVPSYKDYGGRGITVCNEWLNSFEAFLRDVGARPVGLTPSGKRGAYSIDRYPNNDGNYEQGNVRWATWDEQAANRRCTWESIHGTLPLAASSTTSGSRLRRYNLGNPTYHDIQIRAI